MTALKPAALWGLAVALLLAAGGCGFTMPKAKITIRVVDENGSPVAQAKVTLGGSFHERHDSNAVGLTDSNGLFTATVRSHGSIAGFVEKQGFYQTTMPEYRFGNDYSTALRRGKWLPWNPTNTIIIKKTINPIAMLNGGGDRYLPALNVACGYDLVVNDWVAPHGKGKNSDFIFTANGEVVDNLNFRGHLQLRFPNPHDGILQVPFDRFYGSELRLPRVAPANGYQPEWHWRVGYGSLQDQAFQPPVDASTAKVAYVFRVRTAVDDSGQIVRAHYGCLVGELAFDPRTDRGAAFLRFNYYLNPTPNDRNLERDPEKTVSSLVP